MLQFETREMLPKRCSSVARSYSNVAGKRTAYSLGCINRLSRADFSRDPRLLEASIAGVVLSVNPGDLAMRARAAIAWDAIRAMLSDHILCDANGFMPWTGDNSISPMMAGLLERRCAELRSLATAVRATSFAYGPDSEVSIAGKALCRLAVLLDDLMDGAPRRLATQLRQYVFCASEEVRLSS
jgi:hypothetical protein